MGITKDITQEVEAWAVSVIPELETSFDHAESEHAEGFPDIAVEVTNTHISDGITTDSRLAKLQQVQQKKRVQIFDLELILVTKPEPAHDAEDFLKDKTDALIDSALSRTEPTTSGFYFNMSPRRNFRPPMVEFDDGSRGRIVTLYLQVGKPMEEG